MGILLVYDITNPTSFDHLAKWLRLIQQHSNADVQKMILGNKCDLEEQRKIPKERGEAIARQNGVTFLETSAKENVNIEDAFFQLSEIILEKKPAASLHSTSGLPPLATREHTIDGDNASGSCKCV